MRCKILMILFLIFPFTSTWSSNLNEKLNEYFNSFGSVANFTAGEVYEGQKAGYATGGGVSLRNRVMNSKLAGVQLPEIDAGCGGIDIYTGGFSFINSEELINTLKSIGSNAKGYAFMLGLETVSPQVTNTIRQLQSWANTINGIGINSCETAAQLVGSVWPRNTMAKEHICRAAKGSRGLLNDYIVGRQQCNEIKKNSSIFDETQRIDLLFDEYNIAWSALRKQSIFSSNEELAELFMTLMGTLIVRTNNNKTEIFHYPSRIKDESFIKVLLEGGKSASYKCNEKKQCLIPTEEIFEIDHSQSWTGKVKTILLSMQRKILADEELTQEETNFLSKSRLPLYKIVNVLTAYKKGICPIDLYQIADIVAMDMLAQCFKEGLDLIRDGCRQLRNGQMYAAEIDDYIGNLDRLAEEVRHIEIRSSQMIERELQILQKMQMLEEQIASEIILF